MIKKNVCISVAFIIALMLLLCSCELYTELEPGTLRSRGEAIIDRYTWPDIAAHTPFAVVRVTEQTDAGAIHYSDKTTECVKCVCDVLYFNSAAGERFADFNGAFYVPKYEKEIFSPGATVLVKLYDPQMLIDGEKAYYLIVDDNNRVLNIKFEDGRIVLGADWWYYGFHILKEVNDEIEKAPPAGERTDWRSELPEKPLTNGMSIEEVIDYLKALYPTYEKYRNCSK